MAWDIGSDEYNAEGPNVTVPVGSVALTGYIPLVDVDSPGGQPGWDIGADEIAGAGGAVIFYPPKGSLVLTTYTPIVPVAPQSVTTTQISNNGVRVDFVPGNSSFSHEAYRRPAASSFYTFIGLIPVGETEIDATNLPNGDWVFGVAGRSGLTLTDITEEDKTVTIPFGGVVPGVGSVTTTGYVPSAAVSDHTNVTFPTSGDLVFQGYVPEIASDDNRNVTIPKAILAFTRYWPTIPDSANKNVTVPVGNMGFSHYPPTVDTTSWINIEIPVGSISLSGLQPTSYGDSVEISVPVGSIAFTGYIPTAVGDLSAIGIDEYRSVAFRYYSGTMPRLMGIAQDGDEVLFDPAFPLPPVVILRGGAIHEPRAAEWSDTTYNTALPVYIDRKPINLDETGFNLRGELYQKLGTMTLQHVGFLGPTIRKVNWTTSTQEADLDGETLPAHDDSYKVTFDVNITLTAPTIEGKPGRSVNLTVLIENYDTTISKWVTRDTKLYEIGATYETGDRDVTYSDVTVTTSISGLGAVAGDKFRLKIGDWGGDTYYGAFTVAGNTDVTPYGVSWYTTATASRTASMTPDTEDAIEWEAFLPGRIDG